MASMAEEMLKEYEERFDALKNEAFEHHKRGDEKAEMEVIKKMAPIKMMIDAYKSMIGGQKP